MASQNDAPPMQYTIAPSDSRRDAALDAAAPFSHQSLGQALGSHLPSYHRPSEYRISPSPSPIHPHHTQQQQHVQHSFAPASSSSASPQMSLKRKHGGSSSEAAAAAMNRKRQREIDEASNVDGFDGGQGAKHWTDDEKTKLFNWLMGPGQDEHWNALRATKNSCLRECAVQVFGSKKTYQALKGCYERNFNLFKQIYAFETWSHQVAGNNVNLSSLGEADRLKEYERRLQAAKKAGCDVGNITARTIDHWHRAAWYHLFYTRWHGDPATTKPTNPRGGMSSAAAEENEIDLDDTSLDFGESNLAALSSSHEPLTFINSQSVAPPHPPPISHASSHGHQPQPHHHSHPHSQPHPPPPPPQISQSHPPPIPITPHPAEHPIPNYGNAPFPPMMVSTVMQYLQVQTQAAKVKLEYLRRKEDREERDSTQRRELDRLRAEREIADTEQNRMSLNQRQKADRAVTLLEKPNIDPTVKAAAADYLKRMFTTD